MGSGLRVLITGATSGLGREMAVQLGREGARLALTGRRRDRLQETCAAAKAAGAAEALALEGSASDRAVVAAHYREIKARFGGLDWAVLNAGVSESRSGRSFSAENVRWTFETNVFGVAEWLEAVLPDMLSARSGVIAGVSSLAGFRGLPLSGSYSASKAALNTLLESTRIDLLGSGVDVVTICPGFVKSEMTDKNEVGWMPFMLTTEDGTRRMIDGIRARRRIVHFPWQLSLSTVYLLPNLPGWLYDRIMGVVRRRKKKDPQPAAA
ncbi:MAG: SDR family NAD(P)-dependent oxidoreductase [Elusimicrobia bacterium]|nr:SDR family NAD(P)-dependent oxidoreductase [Elusimicrobiota bacterium]